jgi:hypothetical protein
MAPGLGIEPRLTESKSVVLPLHNPGIIKQDTFFTKGLEPFAQPLSESAKRQMLESNQRVINDFAVRILNLVSLPGFEPGSLPLEWNFDCADCILNRITFYKRPTIRRQRHDWYP